MIDRIYIGKKCKEKRKEHKYTQLQVSFDLHFSVENVSAFECGRNDNYEILMYYLFKFFTNEESRNFILIINGKGTHEKII